MVAVSNCRRLTSRWPISAWRMRRLLGFRLYILGAGCVRSAWRYRRQRRWVMVRISTRRRGILRCAAVATEGEMAIRWCFIRWLDRLGIGGINCRRSSRSVGTIWTVLLVTRIAHRTGPRAVRIVVGGCRVPSPGVVVVPTIMVPWLRFTLPHPHVAADSHAAPLIGDFLAQSRAFHQAGELLCTEHVERVGLDFHAPINSWRQIAVARIHIEVDLLLRRLEKAEREAILAFVANGKIGEDEVTGGGWAIEVGHTRSWHAGQNRGLLRSHAPGRYLSILLKTGV